ncbi:MAG: LPXTG cell wall anchor domain-containing protein [Clostridia bacterium]|nr:LPXTG cell wall anchor domain-containing protein [Clostridia bacterium]
MKKLFGRILCLALCAFALVCGAAMAEPVFTIDMDDGYITGVSMDDATEALKIPATVDGIDVRGIDADVFDGYHSLKYILLEADSLLGFKNKSLDFSSAENLECIFIHVEPTTAIYEKFKLSGSVIIQQHIGFPDAPYLSSASISYGNGNVRLKFPEIIGATIYRVSRTVQGLEPDTSDRFDSLSDISNFSIMNGTVSFTDGSAEPGKNYFYDIEAMNPFWSSSLRHGLRISIPEDKPDQEPDKIPDEEPEQVPGEQQLPQTGDGTNLAFWAALAAMSAIGMLIIRKRKAA